MTLIKNYDIDKSDDINVSDGIDITTIRTFYLRF
jgi:hypothetical protein